MTRKKTRISGEEFVGKILNGERDFSNIYLEKNFDLNGNDAFTELQEYLRSPGYNSDLELRGATLIGLKANGIYLPYLNAPFAKIYHSQFSGAHLPKTNLCGSVLTGSNFNFAKLWNADLSKTRLERTQFKEAELNEANLAEAVCRGTNFRKAELVGVNLTKSRLISGDFSYADLRDADLSEAYIYVIHSTDRRTLFKETDLTGVKGLESVFIGKKEDLGQARIDRKEIKLTMVPDLYNGKETGVYHVRYNFIGGERK
ncbi:pentapeptide repeat-containing protein [Candidatus Pacearchaeota archaeon]|nr:pentapeptide repeat-containing protein [Candidatus Pacearchaeota archaeon]